MGSGSSREEEPSFHSDSASWSGGAYAQSPYSQGSQSYVPQQSYSSPQYHLPSENYHGDIRNGAKFERRYSRIADNYKSLEEVTKALARAGLESSNLIIGIDFTKSNEWTGEKSYNKRSLHDIRHGFNPYEQAISIVGKTMSAFDDDNLIPCFGFGDASTHDQDVFSFFPDGRFCNGFEEVLSRYREIVPHLRLAGPTSFAPVIEMATTIVEQSGGQYHVLLIIADGQVTRSVDTERGRLSPQEQRTVDAIVEASKFPLSIILVGVGDGPWDTMREFDDNIPARAFDNFQFVNFTNIMLKNVAQSRKETEFALAALMEIPSQYKATLELNLLGSQKGGRVPQKIPLPPPAAAAPLNSLRPSQSFKPEPSVPPYMPSYPPAAAAAHLNSLRPSQSFKPESSVPSYVPSYPVNPVDSNSLATAPSLDLSSYDNQFCSICLSNPKDLAFGCGHQTCTECGQDLQTCPFCRGPIHTRLKLYS